MGKAYCKLRKRENSAGKNIPRCFRLLVPSLKHFDIADIAPGASPAYS